MMHPERYHSAAETFSPEALSEPIAAASVEALRWFCTVHSQGNAGVVVPYTEPYLLDTDQQCRVRHSHDPASAEHYRQVWQSTVPQAYSAATSTYRCGWLLKSFETHGLTRLSHRRRWRPRWVVVRGFKLELHKAPPASRTHAHTSGGSTPALGSKGEFPLSYGLHQVRVRWRSPSRRPTIELHLEKGCAPLLLRSTVDDLPSPSDAASASVSITGCRSSGGGGGGGGGGATGTVSGESGGRCSPSTSGGSPGSSTDPELEKWYEFFEQLCAERALAAEGASPLASPHLPSPAELSPESE
jgi:hypothetical protein